MATTIQSGERNLATIVAAIIQILRGKLNSTGQFTLTPSAISTVVSDPNVTANSFVSWSPITTHAANDMATTSYVAAAGSFTLTHASNARADRTFSYLVIG
jgi:hypothetical protein